MERIERLDVLVKGIPVQLHNIFKGFCAVQDKTVKDVMDRYHQASKKK